MAATTDAAGSGTLANYFNADWLYATYIATLNPPVAVKPKVMLDLQRLANGFKLQHAQGEDAVSSINHLHATLRSTRAQNLLAQWILAMNDPAQRATFMGTAGSTPSGLSWSVRPLSAAEQEQARKAREDDAAALAGVRASVRAFGLPYDLSASPTPWISWTPDFALRKKGGGGGGGPSDGGGSAPPAPTIRHNVKDWNWINGDLLYLDWNHVDNPDVNKNPFGHLALMDRSNPDEGVAAIDSHPANTDGVHRYADPDDLAKRYKLAQGHHMNIEYREVSYGLGWVPTPMSRVRAFAVSWARLRVGWGVPYSAWASKNSSNETYCSLFVWAAYQYASGWVAHQWGHQVGYDLDIDLDSDRGYWVTPRDILRSRWVQGAFRLSDWRPKTGPGVGAELAGSAAFHWPVRIETASE